MKKMKLNRILGTILSLAMVLTIALPASSAHAAGRGPTHELLSMEHRPGTPKNVPDGLSIDWNHRYTFAELEQQLKKLAETYPKISEMYSIGTSWQERDLWCLEITNKEVDNSRKTGIGVFANIHGGERESASSAMYAA